jgi:hypothetical protein
VSDLGALRRIMESSERLAELSRAQFERGSVNFEHLVTEYVAVRKQLAQEFQILAEGELVTDEPALDGIKRQVTQRMRELFGGRIPDRYLKVRGYSGIRSMMFEYLVRHVGEPVPASRLRVLAGDQVHTERRLRELRDLGLHLTSTRVADDDQYILHSAAPDLDRAARVVAEHNVRNDRNLADTEALTIVSELQVKR